MNIFRQKVQKTPLNFKNERDFKVREAGLEPARPEWTLEPERFGVVLNPVNSVHNVPKICAF